MLHKTTLQFLQKLQKNNNKPWMDANRPAYEAAKADWEQLVDAVIKGVAKLDAGFADLTGKQCTFRMNRDVRFSKNKEPYKCNFGASIKIGGKKSAYAGFYFHTQPGSNFIGGGFWLPEPPVLAKIRQEIDYDLAAFKKIITNKKFKEIYTNGLSTEYSLVNIPKGYDAENAAAEYLKLKSFTAVSSFSDAEIMSKDAAKIIITKLTALKPFLDFLNRGVE
jgi:uncharacterized protein (TIGR02453 family)